MVTLIDNLCLLWNSCAHQCVVCSSIFMITLVLLDKGERECWFLLPLQFVLFHCSAVFKVIDLCVTLPMYSRQFICWSPHWFDWQGDGCLRINSCCFMMQLYICMLYMQVNKIICPFPHVVLYFLLVSHLWNLSSYFTQCLKKTDPTPAWSYGQNKTWKALDFHMYKW